MQDRPHSTDLDADVIIVGYGPVGATLANLLGLRGVKTIVLEREAAAYHLPRAVHFDDEVMRIFETIGLADDIVPHTVFSPGMHFVDSAGKLLMDWSRPPGLTPQGWYPSYRFHQPDLEQVLRDGIRQWPDVSVRTRADVFAIDTHPEHVTVRFEELATGKLSALRAQYVVGCDGARSLVRRFMGVELDDLGFHERWLVLDFILQRPRDDLGDYSIQFCEPVRPATYVRGVGNRRRWEITLLDGEDAHAMTAPERIWPLLKRWVGPEDGHIERAAVYTFHSVVAARWRCGRLLLAGDAAHQTPPFLGQGMCAGIRDAANLAWKLADVAGCRESGQLLDSYESERSPHVREYIERAVRVGGIINTRYAQRSFTELGRQGDETVRFASPKPRLGPGLCDTSNALAGQLAPQPTLSCGARLDRVAGYEHVVLARPGFAAALSPALAAAISGRRLRIVHDPVPELQGWLEEFDIEAALVRPDRYIAGTARNEADLLSLLQLIRPRNSGASEVQAASTVTGSA